jgi:hypothetical protein
MARLEGAGLLSVGLARHGVGLSFSLGMDRQVFAQRSPQLGR